MTRLAQQLPLAIPRERLIAFCKKWKVQELAFFGSFVRADFGPESDIDILVKFLPDAGWSLLNHISAQYELAEILGRRVDLVTKGTIENSQNEVRRNAILGEAKVFFPDEEAA